MAFQQSRWRVWFWAAALAMAGSSATAWQVVHSRVNHLEAAARLAQSLSNTAAQRLGGTLRSLDILLGEVAQSLGNPEDLDETEFAFWQGKIGALPEAGGIAVIDRHGRLRQSHHADQKPSQALRGEVADRSLSRFPHDQERRLFLASLAGPPALFLSRPIVDADNRVLGTAGMVLRPSILAETLAAAIPGANDAASAFTPDGLLVERVPAEPRFVGRSIADSDLFRAYQSQGGGSGSAELAISFTDGRARVVGFTPVPHYPLVVAVGIDRERVLGQWYREALVHGSVQALFVAVIFLLAWGLARSESRRETVTEQLLASERQHVSTLEQAVAERTCELNASLAALRDSEERFRHMVDISPMPLVLTRRADNRLLYINAGAAEAFGVPQAEAEGKIALHFWENPADRARMIDLLMRDGQVRNLETRLKRANGERFDALLSATTVTLHGEDLVLVSIWDITERKRLEKELARSNSDLEQFSYAVSHDLQEPLRMVSSYLALLERRYGQELDKDAREFIAFAVDGAQRMSRMITDLLEYSRVHRRGSQFSAVPLASVVAEALANLSAAIRAAGADIRVAPLPTVWGDASQLMRVFQNLIGNALKYHLPGVAPVITVDARLEDGSWLISVTDNGIGIDNAHAGRLFQVFQRLHPRGTYEGSGVGLALCRRILERHNGRIWMESEGDGKGAVFHFTLPASPEAVPEAAKSPRQ